MVRNYIRKTTRGSWPVEKMRQAMDAVLSKTMGYQKAAKLYGVPQSTLAGRAREMMKYQTMLPSEITPKTEKPGSEDEQHEEIVEAYAPYQPRSKLRKIQSVRIQNEAHDNTGPSFSTRSLNEPLDQTCSFITDSIEGPTTSIYSMNPTAFYWSHKLDNLDPTQKLYAEKYINEILLEAQLGNLGRNSIVINGCDQTAKSSLPPVDSDCMPTTSSNN